MRFAFQARDGQAREARVDTVAPDSLARQARIFHDGVSAVVWEGFAGRHLFDDQGRPRVPGVWEVRRALVLPALSLLGALVALAVFG